MNFLFYFSLIKININTFWLMILVVDNASLEKKNLCSRLVLSNRNKMCATDTFLSFPVAILKK